MMKKKFLKYSAVVGCTILLFFTSCNSLDLAPTNKFTEDNYWSSPEKANMVLNMAYSQMLNSGNFFSNEALSDNLYEGRGVSSEKNISSKLCKLSIELSRPLESEIMSLSLSLRT